MTKVDTDKYLEFVEGVTSPPSLDWPVLAARLSELEVNDCNVTQLMTAALGLVWGSEGTGAVGTLLTEKNL